MRLFTPINTLQQTEMRVSTDVLYTNISKLREMPVTEGAGVNQRKLARPSMWNTGQIPAHSVIPGRFPVFSLATDDA